MAIKINTVLTAVGEDLIEGLAPLCCFFMCWSDQNKQISLFSFFLLQVLPTQLFWVYFENGDIMVEEENSGVVFKYKMLS